MKIMPNFALACHPHSLGQTQRANAILKRTCKRALKAQEGGKWGQVMPGVMPAGNCFLVTQITSMKKNSIDSHFS